MAIKGRENTNESGGVGEAGREGEGERGRERERGGSLGFQYESEWEKGRWEGKVGGCEEREECMGGKSFFSFFLSLLSDCILCLEYR